MPDEPLGLANANGPSAERVREDSVDHSAPILLQIRSARQKPPLQELPILRRRLIEVSKEGDEFGGAETLESCLDRAPPDRSRHLPPLELACCRACLGFVLRDGLRVSLP